MKKRARVENIKKMREKGGVREEEKETGAADSKKARGKRD